jgi:hypothetical protein
MTLGTDALRQLVREVITTSADEIGCQECLDHMGRYAEMTMWGGAPAETMPAVHDHLEHCTDCRTEFQALLDALQSH